MSEARLLLGSESMITRANSCRVTLVVNNARKIKSNETVESPDSIKIYIFRFSF